jgi:hypothetical protein
MKVSLMIALRAVLFLTGLTTTTQAQTAADSAAIRATALDYIDGWYSNNAARMERALHPKLAKRMVWSDSTGKSHLVDVTAPDLVEGAKSHPKVPAAEREERREDPRRVRQCRRSADRCPGVGGLSAADQVEWQLEDHQRRVGEPAREPGPRGSG